MIYPANSWWELVEKGLSQGDLLPKCLVPIIPNNLDDIYIEQNNRSRETATGSSVTSTGNNLLSRQGVIPTDLIIVTQSCDIGNGKTSAIALAQYITLTEYQNLKTYNNEKEKTSDKNSIRNRRVEGILMLPPPDPLTSPDYLIVNFREIFSLPFNYIDKHSATIKPRFTLKNPYKEYFSQTFGSYYMRVALSDIIPPFK